MRPRKGLTVFELIVVIIAILVLMGTVLLLIPCTGPRAKHVHRIKCQSNVKNIGIACAMYAEDTVHWGHWMWINGNEWDTPTGTHRKDPYPKHGSSNAEGRAITELLFMLVRRGHCGVGLFNCPAREGAEVQREVDLSDDSGADYDFADAKYVSYSYVGPILMAGRRWKSGAYPAAKDPAKIAVLGDKNPAMDGGGSGPWGDSISDKQRKSWLSHNHGGQTIGVLWLDYHVSRESRADIGIDDDCIYTAGGDAGPSRSATSTNLSSHKDPHDSFLIGPYGKR